MVKKRIVCLANSRMKPGRCIAGKDIESGSWIRLVNGKAGEGLSKHEYQYGDESDPKVLDIIEVPLTEHCPQGHQTENWLLYSGDCLKRASKPFLIKHRPLASVVSDDCLKHGRVTLSDLANLVDDPSVLWGYDSLARELGFAANDRVTPEMAENLSCSLYFIKVDDMVLRVKDKGFGGSGSNQKQIRGTFTYYSDSYNLVVTDPEIEDVYTKKPQGEYPIGECHVTVSLAAEPWKRAYYKLIAAIILPKRAGERTR